MRILPLVVLILAASGCSFSGTYEPTVDTFRDPRVDKIPEDKILCKEIALQKSGADPNKMQLDILNLVVPNSMVDHEFIRTFANCLRSKGHIVIY